MSIVPINDRQTSIWDPFSRDAWDPFRALDLFTDFAFPFPFPSLISSHFPQNSLFPSVETQLRWSETPSAHVFKAYLPGLTRDQVIVFVDDEGFLQICTDNNKFSGKFKLPGNARTDQVTGFMDNGFLVVTVPKEGALQRADNVRVVEIEGDG